MSGLLGFDRWVQIGLSLLALALAMTGRHVTAQTLLLWSIHLLLINSAVRRPGVFVDRPKKAAPDVVPPDDGEDVRDMF